MNKADLVNAVARQTGQSKKAVAQALDSILGQIAGSIAAGYAVRLVGFGTFDRAVRAERTARNPKSGEQIWIAEHYAPRFKAGKELKQRLLSEDVAPVDSSAPPATPEGVVES